MSRLKNLLSKHDDAPPTPAAPSGIQLKPSSTPSKHEPVDTTGAAGLNALIKGKKAKAAAPRVDNATPTTLGAVDIQLTSDVTEWPDDMEGADMALPANQLRAHLIDLAKLLVTDDVSNAMQRVMVFLHDHPETKDLLVPEDVQLCVKALQASSGVTIAKKTARKSTTNKRQTAVDDLASELADIF